jgi:hypothetical protein
VSLILYVVMLMLLTKVIGIGLEYYGIPSRAQLPSFQSKIRQLALGSGQRISSQRKFWQQLVAVVLYSILREYAFALGVASHGRVF